MEIQQNGYEKGNNRDLSWSRNRTWSKSRKGNPRKNTSQSSEGPELSVADFVSFREKIPYLFYRIINGK